MINEILLGLANFLTSAMTAITGLGGGMLLIGLMPLFVPAAAIIPVHAVTQLVSNGSRAWFGRKYIQTEHLAAFIFGSLLGMGLFGTFIQWLELQWIPFFIGLYI
ncbi:MAG: sulfite exporter TauE/SafE family protein, partial [Acinetobacter sp.]|nr:sulfite exporter TauE/SafE family protein [Acinetobacter sp.]